MLPSHPHIYETIGRNYSGQRIPDLRIAQQIERALGEAKTVCNVGAGVGSYEPEHLQVTAVEPSATMIAQRTAAFPVVQATAEDLPFEDNTFDASMALLSIHHWTDPLKGLNEMKRVSQRQVIFTFDPDRLSDLWIVRDYLPEVVELEKQRALSIGMIADCLDASSIQPVLIPWDCTDGFQAAYWRRPERYLEPDVQASISSFAQLPKGIVDAAIERLRRDLESGRWRQTYRELLDFDSMDLGYRLIVAG